MNTPVWRSMLWFLLRAGALLGICIFLVARIPSEAERKRLIEQGIVLQHDETGKIVGIEVTEETFYEGLVKDLSGFSSIQSVRLKQIRCNTEFLSGIVRMPEVQSVFLPGCEVTDDQLKLLQRLQLHSIDLSNTIGPVNGLAAIGIQENLKSVTLRGCAWVTDDVVSSLSKSPRLQNLDVANTNITDSAFSVLSSLTSLKIVSLAGCRQLSDKTLEHLERLKRLRNLFARDVSFSLARVAKFRQTRPEVILNHDQILAPDLLPLIESGGNPSSHGRASTDSSVLGYAKNDHVSSEGILHALKAVIEPTTDPFVLKYLPQLKDLTLSGSGIDDAAIAHLREMKDLKYLNLSGSKLSHFALNSLPVFNDLQGVGLTNTTISPAMLQWLSNHPKLTRLTLSRCVFTDADFAGSYNFANLDSLHFSGSSNVPRVLNHLVTPKLSHLRLASRNLSDADLTSVAAAPKLQLLDLSDNPMQGHGLKAFQNSSLGSICLSRSGITDSGLETLSNLSELNTLDLSETAISGVGLRELSAIGIDDLDLSETALSDEGAEAVCQLTVSNLQLKRTSISQSSVELLARRLKLWRLAIDGKPEIVQGFESGKTEHALLGLVLFNAEAGCLGHLKNFRDMRSLSLSHCDIDLKAADSIAEAPSCERLALLECKLSPEALSHIVESSKISHVNLYGTAASPNEIERLKQTNPDFRINVRPAEESGRLFDEFIVFPLFP